MLRIDPEIQSRLEEFAEQSEDLSVLPPGDWLSRRERMNGSMSAVLGELPRNEDIVVQEFTFVSEGNAKVDLRWYKSKGSTSKGAALYIHGGGKIGCSLDVYDPLCRFYASSSDIGVLAVGYRLSPEHPYPVPLADCYGALQWMFDSAPRIGVDRQRIAVMGDSGGGGLAAGVALLARDRSGPELAKQLLIYPMLDDRNVQSDPALAPLALWTYDDNLTGWQCFLGNSFNTDNVSAYASPARATDLTNLPEAFVDVGDIDIFRDETISYAQRLSAAAVPVELHVYPGAPHGFDIIAFESDLAKSAWSARVKALAQLNGTPNAA